MKKKVYKLLGLIILIVMLFSLCLNHIIQMQLSKRKMDTKSQELFWQIDQILSQNQTELHEITKDFAASCLTQARATAYIVQHNPHVLDSQEEINKIAQLLQVDEFHVFDASGLIYAGSEPKYFGYTFESGEQMQFFSPMLEDKTLELCQEIAPNTAEGKLMQYAAVWTEDGENIVQIGMEPQRVIKATKRNELSYIFSLLTADNGMVLYAADPETHEILGSTDRNLVGKTLTDVGFNINKINNNNEGFFETINGQSSYSIFSYSEHSVLLGRSATKKVLYHGVNTNTLLLLVYLVLISAILIICISKYLEKHIIKGIFNINKKLQHIIDGNLDEQIDVKTTPEFAELIGHINLMIKSILETTDMLSSLLDVSQMPIGVYEYTKGIDRIKVTNCIWDILDIDQSEKEKLISNQKLFENTLRDILIRSDNGNENIYKLCGDNNRYIKMESFIQGNNVIGILIDVSEDISEKRKIKKERDEDILTGLLNRRGFHGRLNKLFANPTNIQHAAIIMIDSDNLKMVNDTYGHDAGDQYLCAISDALCTIPAPKKLVSRLSGDEFAVLIYRCITIDELHIYINEVKSIQKNLFTTINSDTKIKIPVDFSIGYHICPKNQSDYQEIIKVADQMMYEDKRKRKQRKKQYQ